MTLCYREGNDLDLDRIIELYRVSTLGERRPADNRGTMRDMLAHANLVISAWDGEQLVGLARSLTDFSYVAYLSDIAVRVDYQREGIGVQLIEETRTRMGPDSMVILLAAPKAAGYYPHIGFTRHDGAWLLRAGDPLGSGNSA